MSGGARMCWFANIEGVAVAEEVVNMDSGCCGWANMHMDWGLGSYGVVGFSSGPAAKSEMTGEGNGGVDKCGSVGGGEGGICH